MHIPHTDKNGCVNPYKSMNATKALPSRQWIEDYEDKDDISSMQSKLHLF